MVTDNGVTMVVPGDDPPQIQDSAQLDRLEPYGEVILYTDRPADRTEKLDRVHDAEIILNTRSAVSWPGDVLRELPGLELIATCSIGTDTIDLETAAEQGVTVCNQPTTTTPMVAEHAFALMCATAKRVGYYTAELRDGRWPARENVYLQQKTLGVIGAGNIGAELIRLADAFGMDVICWTFNPSPDRADRLDVEFVSLETLLADADVVSLHVRLSPETAGLIGADELATMKQGALLVNTGRGELVDTEALVDALERGHLGGAGLDVFDEEPLPTDHPLFECEQIVLTPHVADQTPESIAGLNEGIVDTVIAYLEGSPRNVVAPTG